MKKIFFILITFFLVTPAVLAEKLPNPLAQGKDVFITPENLISRLVKMILGLTGVLAIIMFMYGAVLISSSAGNSKQVDKGKNVIFWAVIGIVVTFSAYAIVTAVLKVITF